MIQTQQLVNNPDSRLVVRFDLHPVQNEEKSRAEGRPIYDEQEYITIMVPGDKDQIVHRPVWDDPLNPRSDTGRFGAQYREWKATKQNAAQSGTPLAAWPSVTRAQVAEMAHFNITTVEQLAEVADSLCQRFMGIQALKQRARDFLLAAKGNAHVEQMRAELGARDEQIATMKAQLQELGDTVSELRRTHKK